MGDYESKEEKRARRKLEKEKELDDDVLPNNGLYNTDGHLFYHASVRPMTKAQYKRAEEHGINLRSKKNFTIEESIQIFRNWKEFAEKNNIELNKAIDYIMARKSEKHIIQHHEDHHFWVKLCQGLPHRSGERVKIRAQNMMTDDFLKNLDWENLAEQIHDKYYKNEAYDEVTLQKMKKLMEKGYASSHLANILDVPVTKAVNMTTKLRNLEARDDPTMIHRFYESATSFGLDPRELRERVIADDELELDRIRQNVKLDELSFRLHISAIRCQELLKTVLKILLKKFREAKNEGSTEDEAWDLAIREMSAKPEIEEHQIYKSLEIFCQNAEKDDTSATLRQNRKLVKLLKSHGITGFQCQQPEFLYLHQKTCLDLMLPLEKYLFQHLRRGFRFQVKLHCLLWSYKRLEVWEKLSIGTGKTRYEVVLDSELANPLTSKMTRKFLKNEKVVEWIMESRPPKNRRNAATRRLEAGVEAFILYAHQKFHGNFKFPAKLRPLVSATSSSTIQSIIGDTVDPTNTEYLSLQEAKKVVEQASGSKISVKMRNKAIIMKEEDLEGSEDELDDVAHLLEHARHVEAMKNEERKKEIENIFEKADPSKIRRKFRNREDDVDEVWLSDELHRQKVAMDRAAYVMGKSRKAKSKICSKAEVETSDSDSDDDDVAKKNEEDSENEEKDEEEDTGISDSEDSDDVDDVAKRVGGDVANDVASDVADDVADAAAGDVANATSSDDETGVFPISGDEDDDVINRIPDPDSDDSDDGIEKSKSKKRKHSKKPSNDVTDKIRNSRILENSEIRGNPEPPEATILRNMDFEAPEDAPEDAPEAPEASEDAPEDAPEAPEASEDPETASENSELKSKKKNKRKHRKEDPEDPEDSEHITDDVENPEATISADDVEDSEIKSTGSKKKKKRKHQEDVDVEEDPKRRRHVSKNGAEEFATSSEFKEPEVVEKKDKKKKRKLEKQENIDDMNYPKATEDPQAATEEFATSSEFQEPEVKEKKKKKRKHQDSEGILDVTEAVETPDDVEYLKVIEKK